MSSTGRTRRVGTLHRDSTLRAVSTLCRVPGIARVFIIAAGAFLAVGNPGLWAESPRQAVELALTHDATIKSAADGALAAQFDATSTARSVLPTVTLGGSYQYTTATADLTLPTGPGTTQTVSLIQQNSIDTSAGVRWAPFTGFAQSANVELKQISALLAENSLDSTRARIALRTITAFRQAQAAQLQIDTLTSGKQRAELQLNQSKALEKQGMVKKVDVLSLSIASLDYDQKLIAARASLSDSLDQLKSLTGRVLDVPAAPDAAADLALPSLQMESQYRIKALGLQRSALETSRKLAESRYYPTVAVSGALHYGIPGVNPVKDEWMLYGTAGVSISWSYDWGGTTLSVKAADRNLSRLANDEAAAREALRLEFDKAVRDWHAMKEEADLLKASLDLAGTKMNIVKSQYDQGMASTTDFNDSNLELTQAELRYRSQLLALSLKANQIDALSGEPIDQWSIAQ
ncbi:MAG TPA: TolC family protein [Spirochaetia bacterium]|nr:TolC family protein [Spirochaetia bacterium]